jgi:ribosomal protein S18 acetylase RimI-like enzyme
MPPSRQAAMQDPSSVNLAALADEQLVGFLLCTSDEQCWHVYDVVVDPNHRRHGVATTLFRGLFALQGEKATYTLNVLTSNEGARALYDQLGFEIAHKRFGGPAPGMIRRS